MDDVFAYRAKHKKVANMSLINYFTPERTFFFIVLAQEDIVKKIYHRSIRERACAVS